ALADQDDADAPFVESGNGAGDIGIAELSARNIGLPIRSHDDRVDAITPYHVGDIEIDRGTLRARHRRITDDGRTLRRGVSEDAPGRPGIMEKPINVIVREGIPPQKGFGAGLLRQPATVASPRGEVVHEAAAPAGEIRPGFFRLLLLELG